RIDTIERSKLQKLAFISSDESEIILLFYGDGSIEIRDPYNIQHVIDDIIDEKIYYISDECLWVQEISEKQWVIYLQEMLNVYNKTGLLPIKWEVNKHERVIKAFLKSDSNANCWKSIDNIRLNCQIIFKTISTIDIISLNIHGCSLFHNDLVLQTVGI
ncbi:5789_t:CDS:2, partial [Gigaspora rosea]